MFGKNKKEINNPEEQTDVQRRSFFKFFPSAAIGLFFAQSANAGTWKKVATNTGSSLFEKKVALAGTAIDVTSASVFSKTISGATTLTVSNVPATGNVVSFMLDLTNGGSATITWWTGVKWAGGTAPTLTTSGRDLLGFMTHDGGTTWSGLVLGKDLK